MYNKFYRFTHDLSFPNPVFLIRSHVSQLEILPPQRSSNQISAVDHELNVMLSNCTALPLADNKFEMWQIL